MTDQPLAPYYVEGLDVWKSPIHTPIPGGGESISIGFRVCRASDEIGEPGAMALAARLSITEKKIPSHAELNALRKAVEAAEKQFRHYADLHRAKGTSDGDEKAETNERFADMCAAALSPATRGGEG